MTAIVQHSFGLATINVGVCARDKTWGSGKSNTLQKILAAWRKLDLNVHIDVVCAQEVGPMLEGGNTPVADALMEAMPSFDWVREGSYLCELRRGGPLVLEPTVLLQRET